MIIKTCDTLSHVQEYGCSKLVECKPENINKNRTFVGIDKCLIDEIKYLWSQGIVTTGCCCGKHKNAIPDMSYIGVRFEDIDKMKALGYQVRFNPMRPKDEDSFVPKTVIVKQM